MAQPLHFAPLTADNAPPAVRPILVASERQFGFLPDAVARIAHAPATLRHLLAGFAAFEKSSLSAIDREVIAMSVAWENECHYCMAMHSAMLAGAPDHAATVAALRAGTPIPDPRLEALRCYVRALLRGRGRVDDDTQAALVAAGYNQEQALEIVLGVGVYVLSTFLNVVTRSEPDAPFVPFEWSRPDAALEEPRIDDRRDERGRRLRVNGAGLVRPARGGYGSPRRAPEHQAGPTRTRRRRQ